MNKKTQFPQSIKILQAKFENTFYKDKRKLEMTTSGIRRYSDGETSIQEDCKIMQHFETTILQKNMPKVLEINKHFIELEYLKGSRVFNILMDMKELYQRTKNQEILKTAQNIVAYLSSQLEIFQSEFTTMIKKDTYQNYPAYEKSIESIELIYPFLDCAANTDNIIIDLKYICDLFCKNSHSLFRDFTPKNVIIHDEKIYELSQQNKDQWLNNLCELINTKYFTDDYLSLHIKQLDFSGIKYTVPQWDDFITLFSHESTIWTQSKKKSLEFQQKFQDPIFVSTFIVRYIRLAFRKVCYQIYCKEGFNVRYQNDDHKYYLQYLYKVIKNDTLLNLKHKDDFLAFISAVIEDKWINLPKSNPKMIHTKYYSNIFPL